MKFERMKFKEIINGENVEYMVNDKFVTKEVYDKLLADESLYILPPLPKMNSSPENSCDINDKDFEEICTCEDCLELLGLIEDIRELDDHDALNELRNYIELVKVQTHYESLSQAYNELGNSMIKVSANLETELDNILSQFEVE